METNLSQALKPERPAVPELLSVRRASEMLGVNRMYLRGYVEGIGVRLVECGQSLLMTRRDFERVRRRLQSEDASTQSASTL